MAEVGKTSAKRNRRRRGTVVEEKKVEPGTVKGYGADRLRTAAERRVAESSEELAGLLMTKAMEGKLESVKILMKLAEEEKVKKVAAAEEEMPGIMEKMGFWKAGPEDGDVWVGTGWQSAATGKILTGAWQVWDWEQWKGE
jgi:hypothetical protein